MQGRSTAATWRVTSTAYRPTSAQKVTAAGVARSAALCMGQGVSRRSLGGIRHIFSAWLPPGPKQAVKKPCSTASAQVAGKRNLNISLNEYLLHTP